jgi:hypothetical protein
LKKIGHRDILEERIGPLGSARGRDARDGCGARRTAARLAIRHGRAANLRSTHDSPRKAAPAGFCDNTKSRIVRESAQQGRATKQYAWQCPVRHAAFGAPL